MRLAARRSGVGPAFAVGDRVRTVAESWIEVPVGSTGMVVPTPSFPVFLGVAFDHDPHGDGTGSWAMLDCQLEHVHGRFARALRRGVRIMSGVRFDTP